MAIIGGGPAGLVSAFDLRRKGYQVTIFDSHGELGGLLTHGFPSYRLPREVIHRDLSVIERMGIEVRLRTEIGRDISFQELKENYDAIFLGIGSRGVEGLSRVLKELKRNRMGMIQVDPLTLETNLQGIFAGGDAVMGCLLYTSPSPRD